MRYLCFFFIFLFSCTINTKDDFYTTNVSNKQNTTDSWSISGKYSTKVLPSNQYPLTLYNLPLQTNSCYRIGFFQQKFDPNLKLAVSGKDFYIEGFETIAQTANYTEVGLIFCMPATATKNINVFVNNFSNTENVIDSLYIQKIKENNDIKLLSPFLMKTLYEFAHHISIQFFDEVNHHNFKKYINITSNDFFLHHGFSKRQFRTIVNRMITDNNHLFDSLKYSISTTVQPGVKFKNHSEYKQISFAAYSEKIVFFENETIMFNLNGNINNIALEIQKLSANYEKEVVKKVSKINGKFEIDVKSLGTGFYQFSFFSPTDTINAPIIIAPKQSTDVVVLAPVTTWHAYNTIGGKSFYLNYIDSNDVNYVSTLRSMNAVHFDSVYLGHDIFILKNIFDWFSKEYSTTIYPDYFLQAHPELFSNVKTIVLAQHCEYFSPEMYKNLLAITENSNLLALGGNQIYWKVKWHNNFTKIEVRKGGGFFEGSLFPGGLWRNQFTSEASLLGVGYTDAGYAIYSPYKAINTDHWIFENTSMKNQQIFGQQGIDNRGLSGDEMDKIIQGSNVETVLLAKGENPDGGGGEMVIIERDNSATFSCGSIACGSGLGKDEVFTKMIKNFMAKFHKQ